MEAEERVIKKRKLSHSHEKSSGIHEDVQAPTNALDAESSTGQVNGTTVKALSGSGGSNDRHDEVGSNEGPKTRSGSEGQQDADASAISQLAPNSIPSTDDSGQPLSKNAIKRLRKKAEWEAGRGDRKVKRKEKVVAKRERKREARDTANANGEPLPRPQTQKPRPIQLPVTFLIDCDFDDLMRDNERISLGQQLTRSYADNKAATYRAHLAICSFGGQLKQRFDGLMNKHYESWRGVRFLQEDFVDASKSAKDWMQDKTEGGKLTGPTFAKYAESDEAKAKAIEEGETIYLSSDSDYTLTELKPYSTYIIGGLVDKNREKGICHKRAVQKGIKTARLPIGDYLDMASRKVLATNHVNEIMLKWLELGDWGEAFMAVIPKRKGGKLKGQPADGEQTDVEDDANDQAAKMESDEDEVTDKPEAGEVEPQGSGADSQVEVVVA